MKKILNIFAILSIGTMLNAQYNTISESVTINSDNLSTYENHGLLTTSGFTNAATITFAATTTADVITQKYTYQNTDSEYTAVFVANTSSVANINFSSTYSVTINDEYDLADYGLVVAGKSYLSTNKWCDLIVNDNVLVENGAYLKLDGDLDVSGNLDSSGAISAITTNGDSYISVTGGMFKFLLKFS